MKFKNLLSPIKINRFTYKNRIVSAPMVFGLVALDPRAREAQYRKIESRARGGAAAVIIGETDVNFTDANRVPVPPCDFTDYNSEAFRVMGHFADMIHQHNAVAIIELNHPGAEKDPFPGQKNPVGPVSYVKAGGVRVDALDKVNMERIAGEFGIAAKFMIAAGFDGIIVHGGHGFLFTQFLSARTNTRTDEYGGSLENRARFPIQMMQSIRSSIGPDKILDLRLSGEEGLPGGITAEETGRFCHLLEGIIDSVHVSGGLYYDPVKTHQFSSMFHPHGVNAEASAIIKKYTNLPVGVIGGINSPELGEEIIASGQADYVILGRQMIADPEFANKVMNGKEHMIRRCVRCYSCFPGSPEEGYHDLPMGTEELMAAAGYCALNPASGRAPVKQTEERKKVLVIGGGIAGIQAALTASERGHNVILTEKDGQLGGILNFTDVDVDKEDLRCFRDVIIREIESADVEICLGTMADPALIEQLQPDAVILAAGAVPHKPMIPGIDDIHQAIDIYFGFQPGRTIIMAGGGLVGCEAALHLAKTGHSITIVEMADQVAGEVYGMYREALMLEMEKCGIEIITNARCLGFTENSARILVDGDERLLEGDTVLYALGMIPADTSALDAVLKEIPTQIIGDRHHPAKVEFALKSGYDAALAI